MPAWTTDDWGTPPGFMRQLVERYGAFDLDPCATRRTAKAPKYFTVEDDGLSKKWRGNVFLNPPYSDVRPWVKHAARQIEKGYARRVVALLPPCVDTGWWHDWVLPYAQLVFVRGRVHFLGANGKPAKQTRQGNIVAVYESPSVKHGQTLYLSDSAFTGC